MIFAALLRIWRWLVPAPFFRTLNACREHGRVTMAEVNIEGNKIGWYVSIRPPDVRNGPHAHRYSWTGQDRDIGNALEQALGEAKEFPKMIDMTVDLSAPKLMPGDPDNKYGESYDQE